MKLRFYIYLNDDDTVKTRVYPNYKDDLSKDTEQENNQKFYREKISGKISFLNKPTKDFDFIISQPFDTQYNLIIEKSDDFGQTWNQEFLGKFFQTDCNINYDDQKIELQPDTIDDYTAVMSGIEKENNLSELPIEIQSINLQKRPLIQVYFPGEEIVSCFLSGMTWEQEVTNPTTDGNLLGNTYHFSFTSTIRSMFIEMLGTPLEIGGAYITKTSGSDYFTGTILGTNGYKIIVTDTTSGGNFSCSVVIARISDDAPMFYTTVNGFPGLIFNENLTFTAWPGNAVGYAIGKFTTTPIYVRYLLDVPTINGVSTYPIPSEDLVDNNRNYKRVIGYALDVIFASERFSDEPTEWGKNTAGKYFLPPYSLFGQKFYPVARSQWETVSYWFAFHVFDDILEVKGRAPVKLKDSYPIQSAISALLTKFAPGIAHEGTPEFSEFLYGENNPIINDKFRLFITQKSNILNIQYQNPAQKTPMTLQNIMNMLRDCFRCFWYIEDNKFKIEHVKWFKNGGSYEDDPEISYDVTQMKNIRNGKDWAFNTSQITFDKIDMPERFQFKWMDDVSDEFEGVPIEVISRYVMQGKIEEVNVSNFVSDIDYLLLNPSEVSNDGFVLMAAVESDGFIPLIYGSYDFSANNGASNTYDIKPEYQGKNAILKLYAQMISGSGTTHVYFYNSSGTALLPIYPFDPNGFKSLDVVIPTGAVKVGIYTFGNVQGYFQNLIIANEYELPFININNNGVDSSLQNGLASFTILQPSFYVYDLPAKNVEINNIPITVGTDSKRKQMLEFPVHGDFDPMKLVKTHVGLGQVDKISLNLHSRMTKTTLKYDTE